MRRTRTRRSTADFETPSAALRRLARFHLPANLDAALETVIARESGEVRVQADQQVGRIYVHASRIAWVAADPSTRFSAILRAHTGLDQSTLRECYDICERQRGNFAETVVALGLVERETMRRALLQHNALQLARLSQFPTDADVYCLVGHRSYASELLFTPRELLDEAFRLHHGRHLETESLAPRRAQPEIDQRERERATADINESLKDIMGLDGAIAAGIVDWESGMTLGTAGGASGFDIELAASGNTRVVKTKMQVMKELGIEGGIEDILITLESQYHIIRPLRTNSALFIYVALDRERGNLGLARHRLRAIEENLHV